MAEKKFDNIRKTVQTFGIKLVAKLAAQLRSSDSIASGKLINSLNYKLVDLLKDLNFNLQVSSESHFINVDKGRGANKKQPPPSVLQKWVKQKGLATKPNEIKSLAYVIGAKTGKFGIKPKNTLKESLSKISTQALKNQLKEATAKDIEEQIKQLINQTK